MGADVLTLCQHSLVTGQHRTHTHTHAHTTTHNTTHNNSACTCLAPVAHGDNASCTAAILSTHPTRCWLPTKAEKEITTNDAPHCCSRHARSQWLRSESMSHLLTSLTSSPTLPPPSRSALAASLVLLRRLLALRTDEAVVWEVLAEHVVVRNRVVVHAALNERYGAIAVQLSGVRLTQQSMSASHL